MKTYCMKRRKDTENIELKIVRKKKIDQLCNQHVPFVELKSQDL